MRVLFVNDGTSEAGGVETYVSATMAGLAARGHAIAFLHVNRRPAGSPDRPLGVGQRIGVLEEGIGPALDRVRAFGPDVCFSHNLRPLDVEQRLLAEWRVVKMMHGYFGTCIGGQKSFAFPTRRPCARTFGAACLGFYLPRRCGRLRVPTMVEQYVWACGQRALLPAYAAIVVASEHMKAEYLRHGITADRLQALPLFAASEPVEDGPTAVPASPSDVLFLGRMTALKGGDRLIGAVAAASRRLRRELSLVMAGDGPRRSDWEALARRKGVRAEFVGWIGAAARRDLLRRVRVLAVPSVWPEPFGLVGLEAAAAGVPAVAFDVGGIREWLHDGQNGCLAQAPPTVASLANALARALEDPRRLSDMRTASLAVAERLSLGRHLDALERVLARSAGLGRTLQSPS